MDIELPDGWELKNINQLLSVDGVFVDGDWIESKDQDPNGDVRLIQLADIGDGIFKNKSSRFLTHKRAKELNCTFLEQGDILVARMPDPIGRACIFPLRGNDKYVTAVDVAIIRPESFHVNSKFLVYNINNPKKRNEIEALQSGTTRKRISRKNLSTILFPFPKVDTQKIIVDKIEELFSELDKGIENLKTAQQQLKVYRQAVLKWAFEGKLTNENVKDGELPDGWKSVTIGDIFEVFIGSTPSRRIDDYWKGQINWVSSGEVAFRNIHDTKEKITDKGLAESSCKVHPPGTVILAMIGEGKTRGQAAILKIFASHNQNTAAIRVPDKVYVSELLYYYLFMKYEENRKIGSGNNQKALNKERVKSIGLPLIPIKEQIQIVQEIESRLSVCDKMEETITDSLQQAEALRQSILKRAFEGRLV